MKILLIDTELAPNVAHVWGLYNVNVSLNQLQESGYMLSASWKWLGDKASHYSDIHTDGKEVMLKKLHEVLSDADVVVHYNGQRFDVPHLNREFLLAGLPPPAPFKQIDILRVVKAKFRFVSNKLDYVSQALGCGDKTSHEGHTLWTRCMEGDSKAWATMKKYNIQDVKILEKVYVKVRPWIANHPKISLYNTDVTEHSCPSCGSEDVQKRGKAYAASTVYQRYCCNECGGWSRGENLKEARKGLLTSIV